MLHQVEMCQQASATQNYTAFFFPGSLLISTTCISLSSVGLKERDLEFLSIFLVK